MDNLEKALKKLLDACKKLGEDKVLNAIYEAYDNGAKAEEIIYNAIELLP